MEEKNNFKLFRERSMEAIESPESMNEYLQVTSPGVWIVLASVIAILIGTVLWGIFGRINTSVKVAVVSTGDVQTCYIPYDMLEGIMAAGIVEVDGQEYAMQLDANPATMIISEQTSPYIRVAGSLHIGDVAVEIPVESGLPEGVYTGSVTTESLQPIRLLIQ